MNKKEKKDSFWLSYSDLMTSLFFIMLVLFVICFISAKATTLNQNDSLQIIEQMKIDLKSKEDSLKMLASSNRNLSKKNKELEATNEQLQNILNLESQFKTLSSSSVLRYDERKRTFIAKELEGIEIFEPDSKQIKNIYKNKVSQVGNALKELLARLNQENPSSQFLLIIEGTSANKSPNPWNKDRLYNYELSFGRAVELYNFWNERGINLRKFNTEIQICGSGLNGINRDNNNESNNKRFVIQIIPKVSKPR